MPHTLYAAVSQDIRARQFQIDLAKEACNQDMVCDTCSTKQKSRLFCYFCSAVQKTIQCAECGRTKCMVGDCAVPHPGRNATGELALLCMHLLLRSFTVKHAYMRPVLPGIRSMHNICTQRFLMQA